ncbi:hypothetical protein NUACC21_73940 [Scytonema sp. NUACC21]
MTGTTILVVEDEGIVAKDLQKRLVKLGYNVPALASSGEEAIHMAEDIHPDLILMDIRLKGNIDGVEAVQQIQSKFDVPIIYLTAYADDNTLERARLTEPFGYLLKPFKEKELHTTIEIALSKYKKEKQLIEAYQKQLEHEQTLAKIAESNKFKDEFLSTVSHELRAPLSNIRMAIQLLQNSGVAEQGQQYINILKAECDREMSLINDLLDLQKAESGITRLLNGEPLELQYWLPNIIDGFYARIQEHRQTLRLNISPDTPPLISDNACLTRIVGELLNNACKYTAAGGEIVIAVHKDTSTSTTVITISNSTEIPAAGLPKIFEKFYRVRSPEFKKQQGTGLGLTLVEKLVEQLKGTIEVESTGGWTTFSLKLTDLAVSEPQS